MFWFFGPEAYRILVPEQGMESTYSALESKVLPTGPRGSPFNDFLLPQIRPKMDPTDHTHLPPVPCS